MKKYHYLVQERVKRTVWFFILLGCIYLLLRFALISFFYDMGQAQRSIKEGIAAKICIKVFESSSYLFKYTSLADGVGDYSYLADLAANEFSIYRFTKANEFHDTAYQGEKFAKTVDGESVGKPWKQWITANAAENKTVSREYILSNGGFLKDSKNKNTDSAADSGSENKISNGFQTGDIYYEDMEDETKLALGGNLSETMRTGNGISFSPDRLMDLSFLIRNFYIVDPTTRVTEKLFNAKKLLGRDMRVKGKNKNPQILIYHTHSQEDYIDSNVGKESDRVVGMGTYLAQILERRYGYQVIHDKSSYDLVNGKLDRSLAYNYAKQGLEKNLKKYPSIEVIIDLHRDGSAEKRAVMMNGKETAQIMLFNGLCRDQNGPLTNYDNPYLEDNLAFSLQLQMKSLEEYPGLFYKNYLKCWRYNMHLRPKTLLMELGTNQNTVQSAQNAMEPFAKVLDLVLQGNERK